MGTPTTPGQWPKASFNNLRRGFDHDPIFTPPRPLNTLPSPPRSPTRSPPLPTPLTSSPKAQECSPVLGQPGLGCSASADHSAAVGTKICPQSSEGYNNSFGVGNIFSRKEDPEVEDISSGEELLNDSMNEFENE